MHSIKKLACGVLVLALAVAGCAGADTTWVYRSGGVQPPAGVYLGYMMNSASSAETKLTEASAETPPADIAYKDLLKETMEGQPAAQWILADAQRQMREHLAVELKFAEEGLSLTETEINSAITSAENTWASYKDYYERNGVAQSSVRLIMENLFKRNDLFMHLYGEGGAMEVPEQEIKDALAENYVKVGYMLFQKASQELTDGEGNVLTVEEQNEAAKEQAEAYLKRLQDGEELEDLIFEQEKEEAGENASEVVKPEPDTRVLILSEEMKGVYYSDELVEGAQAIAVGSAAVVEDSSFYYVLRRTDILENPDDLATLRGEITASLRQDEYAELVTGWGNGLDIEANQAAVDRYQPSRLKIDA